MSPLVVSDSGVAVDADYDADATFVFPPIDRLDVLPIGGDVVMQLQVEQNRWEPANGLRLRRGLFRSIPGLSSTYDRGPTGVRFKRADASVAATVDVEAYSLR